ncbi:MIP/aquaporin family protein [Cellulosimicrobium arenosum]|nr:aquaporin [Cellulosimicrobium arenosum]
MSQDTTATESGRAADVVRTESVEVVQPGLLARLGAEVFGTFVLVLAIVGIALYNRFTGGGLVLPVALGGGIAVLGAIAAVGHVSGGHFNPAVTLAAAIGGRTAWRDLAPYWLAQLVGGAIAGLVLFATLPSAGLETLQQGGIMAEATKQSFFSSTANGFGEHSPFAGATNGAFAFEWGSALLVEVIVTAVFAGVILGVTDRRAASKLAPVAIGLTLAAGILIAAPVTNASLNPARSFAAAIFSDSWAMSQIWLFVVGPLVGAALAGLFYRAFAFAPAQDDLLGEETLVVEEPDVTPADGAYEEADTSLSTPAAGPDPDASPTSGTVTETGTETDTDTSTGTDTGTQRPGV